MRSGLGTRGAGEVFRHTTTPTDPDQRHQYAPPTPTDTGTHGKRKMTDPSPHTLNLTGLNPPLLTPHIFHSHNPHITPMHSSWHRRRNHGYRNSTMSSCSSLATHPYGRAVYCCVSPISSSCPRMRRAQRSGLTFWCARNLPFFYLFLFIIVDVGMLLYVKYTSWRFRDGRSR